MGTVLTVLLWSFLTIAPNGDRVIISSPDKDVCESVRAEIIKSTPQIATSNCKILVFHEDEQL
jgi:late competence protein required for DNA uptake (superfamily II DNA/RNA helicase)